MSKEEIINYVMTTPSNPNKAVLEGMLDSITGASEEMTILTEESVTTQVRSNPTTGENLPFATKLLDYLELINADTIQITFEGEKYTCQKYSMPSPGESYGYGGSFDAKTHSFNFSQFPFIIVSSIFDGNTQNVLYTETAGTYQIKIEVPQKSDSSTNEWSAAQVSFSNDSNYYYYVDLAYFDSDNHNKLTSDRITVPGTDESTSEIVVGYTVPLYKNQYFLPNKAIDRTDTNYKVISGRITDTGRGLLIEGDGTIKLRGDTGK